MKAFKASVSGQGTTVIPPPGRGDAFLVVEITIDCDLCGQTTIRLFGHHLRVVANLLQEFIERAPAELTAEGTVVTVGHREWTDRFNPEDN